jgi:hypothetical protein
VTTCYVTSIIFFRLVGPPLQPVEVGLFPGMGCMVPYSYVTRGSRSYLGVLGRNQRPAVPRVNYPDNSFVDDMVAYSDVDWAGCPDTCRSTSGYGFCLSNNLISWSSKR